MEHLTPQGNDWVGTNTQETQSKQYTFYTDNSFVDKNILFTIKAKDGVISSADGKVEGKNVTLTDDDSSGISVTGSGGVNISEAGWVDTDTPIGTGASSTKYIKGISMPVGKTFEINDGIYNWTITRDSNGNVTFE